MFLTFRYKNEKRIKGQREIYKSVRRKLREIKEKQTDKEHKEVCEDEISRCRDSNERNEENEKCKSLKECIRANKREEAEY